MDITTDDTCIVGNDDIKRKSDAHSDSNGNDNRRVSVYDSTSSINSTNSNSSSDSSTTKYSDTSGISSSNDSLHSNTSTTKYSNTSDTSDDLDNIFPFSDPLFQKFRTLILYENVEYDNILNKPFLDLLDIIDQFEDIDTVKETVNLYIWAMARYRNEKNGRREGSPLGERLSQNFGLLKRKFIAGKKWLSSRWNRRGSDSLSSTNSGSNDSINSNDTTTNSNTSLNDSNTSINNSNTSINSNISSVNSRKVIDYFKKSSTLPFPKLKPLVKYLITLESFIKACHTISEEYPHQHIQIVQKDYLDIVSNPLNLSTTTISEIVSKEKPFTLRFVKLFDIQYLLSVKTFGYLRTSFVTVYMKRARFSINGNEQVDEVVNKHFPNLYIFVEKCDEKMLEHVCSRYEVSKKKRVIFDVSNLFNSDDFSNNPISDVMYGDHTDYTTSSKDLPEDAFTKLLKFSKPSSLSVVDTYSRSSNTFKNSIQRSFYQHSVNTKTTKTSVHTLESLEIMTPSFLNSLSILSKVLAQNFAVKKLTLKVCDFKNIEKVLKLPTLHMKLLGREETSYLCDRSVLKMLDNVENVRIVYENNYFQEFSSLLNVVVAAFPGVKNLEFEFLLANRHPIFHYYEDFSSLLKAYPANESTTTLSFSKLKTATLKLKFDKIGVVRVSDRCGLTNPSTDNNNENTLANNQLVKLFMDYVCSAEVLNFEFGSADKTLIEENLRFSYRDTVSEYCKVIECPKLRRLYVNGLEIKL